MPVSGVGAEGAPNSVAVSWTINDDGAAPEGFYVEVMGPEGFAKTVAVAAPATSTEVAGLKNGVEYLFRVTAATRNGSAASSDWVTATPSTGVEGVVAGVIVEFEPGSEKATGEQNVPGESRVEDVDLTVGEKVADDAVLVELSEPVDVDTATRIADDLESDPEVSWAEPDQFFFTSNQPASDSVQGPGLAQPVSVPADSDYAGSQWNLWDTYGVSVGDGTEAMTDAWAGATGDGVNVAVIDTGITSHPDLDGQLVAGYDFVSNPDKLAAVRQANAPPVAFDGDYVDQATYGALGRDANPADPGDWRGVTPTRDSSWHGTQMAGIIAAANNADGITGVAPKAKIQPIRALSWRGGLLSDIAASITWASGGTIDGVPANENPSKVINMSFAVETICPVALQDAIDGARDRGAILIAAAGNASDDSAKFAPGNCDGVITVAASNRDGQRADYSNYGAVVDIAAPGGDSSSPIATTSNTGTQTPDQASTGNDFGTSAAAAHVSAAAAILASRNASLTPDQAYEQLTGNTFTKNFANNTCDNANPDYSCGTGILSLAQIQTVASGDQDYAMNFNGTNQYAYVNDSAAIELSGALTIEAWLNPDSCSSGSLKTFLRKEYSYALSCYGGNWHYALANGSAWYNSGWVNTGVKAVDGAWQHVALTKASGSAAPRFYFNGQLAYTGAAAGDRSDNGYPLYIGSETPSTGLFPGEIDEIRLYSTQLSEAQILADMHSHGMNSGVDSSHHKIYFDFNDDLSGTTGSGTIYNRVSGASSVTNARTVNDPTYTQIRNVSNDDGNTVVAFERSYLTAAGGWRVPESVTSATALVVGGGGGGGSNAGGGAGGGGGKDATVTLQPGAVVEVKVGQGGKEGMYSAVLDGTSAMNGNAGQSSTLETVTGNISAPGGAGGKTHWVGDTCGSGGNPAKDPMYGSGAVGDTGTGGDGGRGGLTSGSNGVAGSDGFVSSTTRARYGGGGGGGAYNRTGGSGGGGGGGDGASGNGSKGSPGTPNTGGGGGGGESGCANGGSGGSGVVVVSYGTSATNETDDLAIELDGSTEALLAETSSTNNFLPRNDFTLEAWVYPTDNSAFERILNRGDAFVIANNSGSWRFAMGNYPSSWRNIYGPQVILNSWTHVAMTRSGSTITAYVNGQEVGTASTSATMPATYDFGIGANGVNGGARFDGRVDEVRIYSTGLTASQVRTDMRTHGMNSEVSASDHVAYYDFNEGVAGTQASGTLKNKVSGASRLTDLQTYGTPEVLDVKSEATIDGDTVVTFPRSYLTSAGGWRVPAGVAAAETLVVAGGGGGGDASDTTAWQGAGGGAGGYLASSDTPLTAGNTITVTVGMGGRAGVTGNTASAFATNGQNSILGADSTVTALGGGYGGQASNAGGSGGSGGGGGMYTGTAGNGTAGQGNDGGNAAGASNYASGGGGGSAGAGTAGSGTGRLAVGGSGGSGTSNSITGTSRIYAAGGNGKGCAANGTASAEGQTAVGSSAIPNTGSGGGGGGNSCDTGNALAGWGGSGIVVVKYGTPSSETCSPEQTQYSADGTTYRVVAFKDTGDCSWAVPSGVTSVDYLVVAGGGGGGGTHAGGGGAGGLKSGTALAVTPGGSTSVSVGAGGSGGRGGVPGSQGGDGESSAFGSVSTTGGGGGGGGGGTSGTYNDNGRAGGSGGGASYSSSYASRGGRVSGEGNIGAYGYSSGSCYTGGGGGGAGAAGSNGTNCAGGNGGIGSALSWLTPPVADRLGVGETSGTSVYFAGGGSGGSDVPTSGTSAGSGGLGGGGDAFAGATPTGGPGEANTGGGGAGGTGDGEDNGHGGDGGSGVVLVRYAVATSASECSPTTTTSGDYTIATFDQGSACSWTVPAGVGALDVLVVGGGGGGGADGGGGGGGGGVRYDTGAAVSGGMDLSVTVGAGGTGGVWATGTGGSAGALSSVVWGEGSYVANGGVGGSGWRSTNRAAAGTTSGDGSAGTSGTGGAGPGSCVVNAISEGTDGASGFTSGITGQTYAGGGGGGSASDTIPMSFTSTEQTLTVGSHGGGDGASVVSGTVNGASGYFFSQGEDGQRGGGGGGGSACGNANYDSQTLGTRTNGGDGGDGVVVLRYLTPDPISTTCTPLTYTSNEYTVVEFQGAGTCSWTAPAGISEIDVLAVGGGGGGGARIGGGGGGGGVTETADVTVTPSGSIDVVVGAGGTGGAPVGSGSQGYAGSNGTTSSFGSSTPVTADGGGGGGGSNISSNDGGSAATGGGAGWNTNAGTGSSGAGDGGAESGVLSNTVVVAGGGGGAAAGADGGVGASNKAGAGGTGKSSDYSGAAVFYGGGGGGGMHTGVVTQASPGPGGKGGGGAGGWVSEALGDNSGVVGADGVDGLGGGGGGGSVTNGDPSTSDGGDGGDGAVIIRYFTRTLAASAGNNQTAVINTELPTDLEVTLTDSTGSAVSGVDVSFAVASGGGSLSASTVTTNSSGKASVTWTLGATNGAQTVTASATNVGDSPVTFTATASAEYTLTYNANGATSGTAPSSQLVAPAGTPTLRNNTGTLAKTGYTFAGWNTEADGTGTSYSVGATSFTMPSSNTTLYAEWTVDQYTITYDDNVADETIAVPDTQTEDYNSTATLSSDVPVRSGYSFTGWNLATDGSGTGGAAGSAFIVPANNTTLYAQWEKRTYTVTYSLNGASGTPPTAQPVVYDATAIVSTEVPTRTGYTFDSWNTAVDGSGTAYSNPAKSGTAASFTMPPTDVTLYAQWSVDSYTLTYDGQGATSNMPSPLTVSTDFGVVVSLPSVAPTRSGYTFTKWDVSTTAGGLESEYRLGDSFVMPDAAVTLTARWSVNSYTLTYDGQGATSGTVDPALVAFDSTLTPPTPSRTGYTFDGWFTQTSGAGTEYTSLSTMPAQDLTLYADWSINEYTLSFAANGGSFDATAPSVSDDYGTSVDLSNVEVPDRTGYTFVGWQASGGQTYASSALIQMPEDGDTLTAQWQGNTYTVTYNLNGDTGTPPTADTYVFGGDLSETAAAVSRAGYTFLGWNTAVAGGAGTRVTAASAYTPATPGDFTLYAEWDADSHDISYDDNGGSGGPGTESADTDALYTVSTTEPTRSGYTFLGWQNSSGKSLPGGSQFRIGTTDVALTAQWLGQTLTLTYDANGGSGVPGDAAVEVDSVINLAATEPSKTGHTFSGWDDTQDGSSAVYQANALFTMPTYNTTLQATWTVNSYTVTFDANGGSDAPSSVTQDYGTTVDLDALDDPNPTRTGYTFSGWSASASGEGTAYSSSLTLAASDVTLYAQWTGLDYTLSYDFNYSGATGTAPSSETIAAGAVGTGSSTEPTRTGWTFTEWNFASDGSGTSVPAGAVFAMPVGNQTLYAQWEVNSYDVIYDANGGSDAPDTEAVDFEATATVTSDEPSRAGYTFLNWNEAEDGSGVDYSAGDTFVMADEDVTLYAQWELIPAVGGGGVLPVDSADPLTESFTPPNEVLTGEQRAVATEDGSTVGLVIRPTQERDGWEVIGAAFGTFVRTQDAEGEPVALDTSEGMSVPQGGRVNTSGSGYLAASPVRVFLVPTVPQTAIRQMRAATGSIYLGSTTTSADGDYSGVFAVPPSVDVGDYVLQVNGLSANSDVRSVNLQLAVTPGKAPLQSASVQRAGFFKGKSAKISKNGERKIRQLTRAVTDDARAVQVLIGGVSVSLGSFESNVALAGKRASKLASKLKKAGISGEYVVNVTSTFTVDAAERALAEKAEVLTTKAGKPLSTVTILFQEPVG